MSKDRFSIHQESGGPLSQEAFTIMRDGGTTANSGLVGITNRGYAAGEEPFLPETIFNTQASGASYIRFSSGPSGVYNPMPTSAITLLGNGNVRSSGVELKYYPDKDNASLENCPNGDCGGNDPVYNNYTLEDCDDQSLVFNIYDPEGFNPQLNEVVKYTDKDGNEGCGTVNLITTSSSQNASSIDSNFGTNGCATCKGLPPEDPVVYEGVICGGSTTVLLSNTNGYDIVSSPVVRFQLNGATTCATVSSTPLFGSAQANIQGVVNDCSDPLCGVPAGTTRYRVEDCDNPGQKYLVDDDSGNTYSPGNHRVEVTIGFEQTICALIESVTSDTGPELIISQTLGQFYTNCDCESSNLIEQYFVDVCDAPYQNISFDAFNLAGFTLTIGQEIIAEFNYLNNGSPSSPPPGYPPNGTQLNCTIAQFNGSFAQAPYMSYLPIVSDNGNCGGGGGGTNNFRKYTIDPCDENRGLDFVTEGMSNTPTANGNVVQYDIGDSVLRCGTITSSLNNQAEIAGSSISASFGSGEGACDTCEGVFDDEYLQVRFYRYSGPVDVVFDSQGNCIPECPECGDACTSFLAWVSTNGADTSLFNQNSEDWIEATRISDSVIDSGKVILGPQETAGGNIDYLLNHPPVRRDLDPNNGISFCATTCELGGLGPGGGGPGGGGGFGSFGSNGGGAGGSSRIVNPNGQDNVVSDISLIRATGTQGFDVGHISITERGYVGIGVTRLQDQRTFIPNSPLTVNYAAPGIKDSGTIAIREQSVSPSFNGNYGKLYVKSFTGLGGSQALFFKDDLGNETNLLLSSELPDDSCCELIQDYEGPSGMVFGDVYGNTYAGWHTPESRVSTSAISKNTLFGWAAGYDMSKGGPDYNTMVGYTAGSGGVDLQKNTVLGSDSLVNYNEASSSVIIGYGNVKSSTPVFAPVNPEDDTSLPTSGIIIGTELFVNNDPPTGILAIGHGLTPVVTGQMTGGSRSFAVDDAEFIVSTGDSTFSVKSSLTTRYTTNIDTKDNVSTGTTLRNDIKFTFTNGDNYTKTLFQIDPIQSERTNVPSYTDQGFQYAQLDADFRIQGAIRFQDGSSLSGVADWFELGLNATSGVNQVSESNGLWSVLDFSELELASARSSDIRTDNTFVSVQLDGTSSSNVGKMDLIDLAGYLSDAFVNISDNCNVIITNPSNEADLDATANSESVFMGCDVAANASGWKNSVIIGTEAGKDAVTPNPTLGTSTAAIFLGYRAGYDSDSVDNTIFIGTAAGRDADAATDSIFVGASAGLGSSYNNSIGIGQSALRGVGVGAGNIEIVTNLLDNQRLLYNAGNVSDKLNIQNIIAGDTDGRNLSIGDAILSPQAPLEVRRDTTVHGGNPNNYIQSWHCDDTVVGAIDCDGSLSGFIVEGELAGNLSASDDISTNIQTAMLLVYENGVPTGQTVPVVNRNSSLSRNSGDYVIAVKIGGEYRPL